VVAIIKGDIIASRKLVNQAKWIDPLKRLFANWGETPQLWEIIWGDSFQVEITNPQLALARALQIKALIRKIQPNQVAKKNSDIDVRMAIGIGAKTYTSSRISESNGPAFIYASEKFELLKKENTNLAIKSDWSEFDDEINLYLKLAGSFADGWSISSAELVDYVLTHPEATQQEIGEVLGIKQNSVSGRWSRARIDEILEIKKVYQTKLKNVLK